jgi:hypothetical protein
MKKAARKAVLLASRWFLAWAYRFHTTGSYPVSQLSRQCGILNITQPYRLPRPVTGIALLLIICNYSDTFVYVQ